MVAATDAGSDMKAAKVASLLGVSAGIYSAQDTSKAWGINGVWAEDVSNYGFSSLPTGVPVVTTTYDKDVSAGINEEQLKDIIENTTYAKISADELCLAGECVTTWEDVVFDPIEAIRNCNLGDVASCVKGFQKGINTSCEAIGKTYKDNGGIALTGFYTLARSSNTFDANQPCVFKDGNVADVPEVITQCNADTGGTKAACRYAWNNSINRSCEQVIAANKSAASGWYNITTSTNASSKACYFVNIGTSSARVGNAQETITTCNAANTTSNVACRFGYDKNYNRSCARIIATWTSATTAFYTLTAASSVSLSPCVFNGSAVATNAQVITQCNASNNVNYAACRYGWNQDINRTCDKIVSYYPAGEGKTNMVTTSTGGEQKLCLSAACAAKVGTTVYTVTGTTAANPGKIAQIGSYTLPCAGKYTINAMGERGTNSPALWVNYGSNGGMGEIQQNFNAGRVIVVKSISGGTAAAYGGCGMAVFIDNVLAMVAGGGGGGCGIDNSNYGCRAGSGGGGLVGGTAGAHGSCCRSIVANGSAGMSLTGVTANNPVGNASGPAYGWGYCSACFNNGQGYSPGGGTGGCYNGYACFNSQSNYSSGSGKVTITYHGVG